MQGNYLQEKLNADHQKRVSDLADDLVSEAMNQGEPLTEGLCNWAMEEAEGMAEEFAAKRQKTS